MHEISAHPARGGRDLLAASILRSGGSSRLLRMVAGLTAFVQPAGGSCSIDWRTKLERAEALTELGEPAIDLQMLLGGVGLHEIRL